MRRSAPAIVLFAITWSLVSMNSEASESDVAKRVEIMKLLDTTGAINVGKQMGVQLASVMADSFRQSGAPEKALELLPIVVGEVLEEQMPEYVDVVVAAYDRTYTLQELRDVNAFYNTETGKKVIQTMPSLTQELFSAGAKIGENGGPEIVRRIKERLRAE